MPGVFATIHLAAFGRIGVQMALAAGAAVLLGVLLFVTADVSRADTVVSNPNCTTSGIQSALNAGGTVTFNCGASPVTIEISPTLVVSVPVTIDGGNLVTLDGKSINRIISTTSTSALTLTNITLANGNASDIVGGGAVYGASGSPVTVIGSKFVSNMAFAGGGGIYASTAHITGSLFVSNTTSAGQGGGVNVGLLTITGTKFVSNTTGVGGIGGGVAAGHVSISDSTFEGNRANSGAGLYAEIMTITASSLVSNTAGSDGGGILTTRATMSGLTFEKNSAGSKGGGVYAASDANIGDSTFMSNTAPIGGGIHTVDSVTISGTTFIRNAAEVGGGVSAATATIGSSIFISNSANRGGGVSTTAVATVNSSVFLSNTAAFGGGVFVVMAAIADSTFERNVAGVEGGGVSAAIASIGASTLLSNTAPTGGAISTQIAQLTNATITGNRATGGGGAVRFSIRMVMTSSTVIDNGSRAITGTASTLPFTLTDSIVGGAWSPLCAHVATLTGKNVIQDTSCGIGPNHVFADPLLGPLQDNGGATRTMAPRTGSPAIDNSPICQVTVDQRGVPRTAPCDIGAYETGVAPVLTALSPSSTTAQGPGFQMTIAGSGFMAGTVALWNGSPRSTDVQNSTTLLVDVPPADIAVSGVVTIQARYGLAPDGFSNTLPFTISTPVSPTVPTPVTPTVPAPPAVTFLPGVQVSKEQ